jgi:hypothetical protein
MKVLAGALSFLRKHNRMDNYVTREILSCERWLAKYKLL